MPLRTKLHLDEIEILCENDTDSFEFLERLSIFLSALVVFRQYPILNDIESNSYCKQQLFGRNLFGNIFPKRILDKFFNSLQTQRAFKDFLTKIQLSCQMTQHEATPPYNILTIERFINKTQTAYKRLFKLDKFPIEKKNIFYFLAPKELINSYQGPLQRRHSLLATPPALSSPRSDLGSPPALSSPRSDFSALSSPRSDFGSPPALSSPRSDFGSPPALSSPRSDFGSPHAFSPRRDLSSPIHSSHDSPRRYRSVTHLRDEQRRSFVPGGTRYPTFATSEMTPQDIFNLLNNPVVLNIVDDVFTNSRINIENPEYQSTEDEAAALVTISKYYKQEDCFEIGVLNVGIIPAEHKGTFKHIFKGNYIFVIKNIPLWKIFLKCDGVSKVIRAWKVVYVDSSSPGFEKYPTQFEQTLYQEGFRKCFSDIMIAPDMGTNLNLLNPEVVKKFSFLESLNLYLIKFIEGHNFEVYDIKPLNILFSNGRFQIIDWQSQACSFAYLLSMDAHPLLEKLSNYKRHPHQTGKSIEEIHYLKMARLAECADNIALTTHELLDGNCDDTNKFYSQFFRKYFNSFLTDSSPLLSRSNKEIFLEFLFESAEFIVRTNKGSPRSI